MSHTFSQRHFCAKCWPSWPKRYLDNFGHSRQNIQILLHWPQNIKQIGI